MKRIRRILHASDFSKASGRAFQTAMTMAKANRARLTVVHVIVPFELVVPEQYVDSGTLDQLAAQARQWGQRQLAKLADRAKRTGARTTTLLREGDPAQQIVCQLQVFNRRGQSEIPRLHNKRPALGDDNFFHQFVPFDFALQINIGVAGMFEHPKLAAQMKID